jgi:hypothetical protein
VGVIMLQRSRQSVGSGVAEVDIAIAVNPMED